MNTKTFASRDKKKFLIYSSEAQQCFDTVKELAEPFSTVFSAQPKIICFRNGTPPLRVAEVKHCINLLQRYQSRHLSCPYGNIMAKVQMLAVLSLDGCLSEKTGDASRVLRPESYDIDKLFDAADYELTPAYPTSRLTENKSNSIFLIEANHETADYINGLLRLQLIDEIIFIQYHSLPERGDICSRQTCHHLIGTW